MSYANFEFQAKRIKFSLKKGSCEGLFLQFKDANEKMRNLLESSDQIAAARSSQETNAIHEILGFDKPFESLRERSSQTNASTQDTSSTVDPRTQLPGGSARQAAALVRSERLHRQDEVRARFHADFESNNGRNDKFLDNVNSIDAGKEQPFPLAEPDHDSNIRTSLYDDAASDSDSAMSAGSSVFSAGSSMSSNSSARAPITRDGVRVFAQSMLRDEALHSICQAALLNREVKGTKFARKLKRLLVVFMSELAQIPHDRSHMLLVTFVKGSASAIAAQVTDLTYGNANDSTLDEPKVRGLGEAEPRLRVAEFLSSLAEGEPKDAHVTDRLLHDVEEIDSDDDDVSSVDSADAQDDATAALAVLEQVENSWFTSEAFDRFKISLYGVVHPTFRTVMMDWIKKQRRNTNSSGQKLQELEVLVSELQHIPPTEITVSEVDPSSITNYLKCTVEEVMGESWDWWPLEQPTRNLSDDEVRLHWTCVSGLGSRLRFSG
jgi:hypothetical protein